MLLPKSIINTESSGVISSSAFNISEQNKGIIFNIVRSKIYKNPKLAMIREIACNARDAHREVYDVPTNPTNRSTPIRIYLPNTSEPNLKIQDFGPGISPNRKDRFISFGDSTKRDDNIQTGGFGLGCKSPFAYSQSFTIDTIAIDDVDGLKYRYVYHAYIDETEVGAMDLMVKERSDAPLGTTIIIPIKDKDFYDVADIAIQCTKHWDVKPDILGGMPEYTPDYPVFKEFHKGDNWTLYSQGVNYACAIVDGIEYRIDRYSLDCSDEQKELLDYGFCLYFNVGELSLAASRDNLMYTDNTNNLIISRLDQILLNIRDIIINSIDKASSFKEACLIYRDYKDSLSKIVSNVGDISWQGHQLRTTCSIKDIGKWAKVVGYSADNDHVRVERANKKIYFLDDDVMLIHNDKTNHLAKSVILYLLKSNPGVKTIQAIYTPAIPTLAAYKQKVEEEGADNVDVSYDDDLISNLKLVKYSSINIPKAKYLPKPTNARGQRIKLEDGNINGYNITYEYRKRGFYGNVLKASSAQFPKDEGGVYVIFDYKNKEFYTNKNGDKLVLTFYRWELYRKLIGEDIIALSPKRASMIAHEDEWVALQDRLDAMFKNVCTVLSGEDYARLAGQSLFIKDLDQDWLFKRASEIEDKDSPLAKIARIRIEVNDELSKHKDNHDWYRLYGHVSASADDLKELKSFLRDYKSFYPLLDKVSHWDYDVRDNIIGYINISDRCREEDKLKSIISKLSENRAAVPAA